MGHLDRSSILSPTPSPEQRSKGWWLGSSILAALLLAGCGSRSVGSGSNAPAGTLHTDGDLPSSGFLVELNKQGQASSLRIRQDIAGVAWGRLVDIADVEGTVRHQDFVVGEDIITDDVDYEVTTNPATGGTTVRIRHPFASPAYVEALKRSEENLIPVPSKSLNPIEIPPFPLVPRNAALVLRFDDILDPHYKSGAWRDNKNQLLVGAQSGQLKSGVVKVMTGYAPDVFYEARVIVSPNHGDVYDFDGDGALEFHPTRVIIDLTVSETQAAASDPPLGVNTLGLPASITSLQPNVVVRIPTRTEPQIGQNVILTNRAGHGLDPNGNGATDPASITLDVVRALRSGNSDDLNNGFLRDEVPPALIGSLSIELQNGIQDLGNGQYLIERMQFLTAACTTNLELGEDLIVQSGTHARILDGQQEGPVAVDLLVEVVVPVDGTLNLGSAQLQTAFSPLADEPLCFVRFSPNAGSPPGADVSKAAQVSVRFSEPMDPAKLGPFDTLTLTRKPIGDPSLTNFDYVVGRVQPSADLREFAFVPLLPLDTSEDVYYLTLASGPTDLAGNPLETPGLSVAFTLDPTELPSSNGGFVFRFKHFNEFIFTELGETEEDDFGELRPGQILYDLNSGRIMPRPVSRFSAAADRDLPVPGLMTTSAAAVRTPLSPMGSKLQTLWRYVDFGFSLTDESTVNLDVEGLAWAPFTGGVVTDVYPGFSIRLAHTKWLPDEFWDMDPTSPTFGIPFFPTSGLTKVYEGNHLDPANDPGTIVHPQHRGYIVSPAKMFIGASGTFMQPWPLNQDLPPAEWKHYTWRDTALLGTGGAQGAGANLAMEDFALGLSAPPTYSAGNVPSIGLPLLMEYRCYPTSGALGLNGFDTSLAAGTTTNIAGRPNFRAFSTGGFDTNNNPIIKHPDSETQATGGFDPTSTPPGAPTQEVDNTFYIGQLELVTRVSRSHSIWFDTGIGGGAKYLAPVVEPTPSQQPLGTQVLLAYRGATAVLVSGSDNIRTNAAQLDLYGDPVGAAAGNATFLGNDNTWKDTITAIDGARFVQFRITFIANAATNLTPSLSSLGFAYSE